jgi:hypothetical protein
MAVMRVHGTTARRPVEMFAELEAGCLRPLPEPCDQPVFTRVEVQCTATITARLPVRCPRC